MLRQMLWRCWCNSRLRCQSLLMLRYLPVTLAFRKTPHQLNHQPMIPSQSSTKMWMWALRFLLLVRMIPPPTVCHLPPPPTVSCLSLPPPTVPSPFPLLLCAVYLPLQLRTISISLYSTAYLTDGGKETADDDADEEDNLDEVETYLEYLNLLKLAEDKLEMELDAYRQLEKDLEHTELEKLRVASPKPAREIRRKRSLNSSECCNTEKNLVFIALNLNYHDSVSTSIILWTFDPYSLDGQQLLIKSV